MTNIVKLKDRLVAMAVMSLIVECQAFAAPVAFHGHPDRPPVHRAGRFGLAVHKPERQVSGIESQIGTPAQAVNILNSTLTNPIDKRAVIERAFLRSIDQRLQLERPLPSFSSRQGSGKNDVLTGKDRNLRAGIRIDGGLKASAKLGLRNEDNVTGIQMSGGGQSGGGDSSANNGPSTQAAGDGSGGSMGYFGDVPDDLNQERTHMEGDKIVMGRGSLLVSRENGASVQTHHAEIHVAPLATAFVVQLGDDVAVLNLGDSHKGDVTVILDKDHVLNVPFGHQIVLSSKESEFGKANPSDRIKTSNAHHLGKQRGIHVFDATYSPISALDNTPQLESLMASTRPEDQQTVNRMFKSMAVLLAVSGD